MKVYLIIELSNISQPPTIVVLNDLERKHAEGTEGDIRAEFFSGPVVLPRVKNERGVGVFLRDMPRGLRDQSHAAISCANHFCRYNTRRGETHQCHM